MNPDKYKSIGTHWIASYVNVDNVIHLDRVEYTPKETKKFIGKKNIIRI